MSNIELSDKEQYLLTVLNKMLEHVPPIKYGEFNKVFTSTNIEKLRESESKFPELGIARYNMPNEGISILSIISTITEILSDNKLRLGVELETIDNTTNLDDYSNQTIIKFMFWTKK